LHNKFQRPKWKSATRRNYIL